MANKNLYNYIKTTPLVGTFVFHAYRLFWKVRTFVELREKIPFPERPFLNVNTHSSPTLENLTSQLCTTTQFLEARYGHWCFEMRSPARLSRKQWEFVFILEAFYKAGCLTTGKRGLGFGCGNEPLAAVMAKYGARVLCTDLETKEAAQKGWVDTNQHVENVENMQYAGICDQAVFLDRVSFQFANMNDISKDLRGFDFVWSACALEHLGSLRHGMDFVINSIDCLAPGGVAVHTTEFNLTSNVETFESEGCSIYRQHDIEVLVGELRAKGYKVYPLNLNPGSHRIDNHVDWPPYNESIHLKLVLESYVVTSIGLVVKKPLD